MILNINASYGGENQNDSAQLNVGDRFRINFGDCAETIVQVNPIESNIAGSFTSATYDAGKSVVVTYQGPNSQYFELNRYVKVAIVIETGDLPSSSCASCATI